MKNIIVLAKQVPDTQNIGDHAMKEDGTVNRAKLPAIFNPEDLNALEMALQIRENLGGSITVISMGPPKAIEILKHSLYMGADAVYLISDRKFAGADTLATSYVLAETVKYLGNCDLILAGRQAIDGDTAQVGPQTAEKLNFNLITYIDKLLEINDDYLIVQRDGEKQIEEIKSHYPVLLTLTSNVNEPRYPDTRKMLRNFRADLESNFEDDKKTKAAENRWIIPVLDAEKLGLEEQRCGLKGSPTRVHKIKNIQLTGGNLEMYSNKKEGIKDLVKDIIKNYIEVGQ